MNSKNVMKSVMGLLLVATLSSSVLLADNIKGVEPKLINALDKINNEKIDDALNEVQDLIDQSPKFHLAKLVYADLLMAKAGMPAQLGLSPIGKENSRIDDLRSEARVRWQRYQERIDDTRIPEPLLQLSDEQKTAVVVDLSRSRLYLFENAGNEPKLLADFYVTQGKNGKGKQIEGDEKTPLGTYFVTSSLDVEKLPDLYGTGAFPIDYPNAWDRRQGNTGHGIWLHGVPSDTYSRAPLATRGCLAMANSELDSIKPFLQTGVTPVIIASELNWVSPKKASKSASTVKKRIAQWLTDWQSRDVDAYLRHYSKNFKSDAKDFDTWSQHKRRVNEHKRYIKVKLKDMSILSYPDQDADMVVVSFKQDYSSNNFQGVSEKRQYWKKEADGEWRIIYEGRG